METGSPYEYLERELWHKLLARAVIFRAMASRLMDVFVAMQDEETFGSSISTAVQQLYQTCENVASMACPNDTIVVNNVVQEWRKELDKLVRYTAVDEARQLLSELDDLVSNEAVPDDPFQELHERVMAKASEVYSNYWREASLSLLHLRAHPRGSGRQNDPYGLTATTKVNGRAEIELQICLSEFGLEAYAAMPIILIHECVCHVPARQYENRNVSLFAEGFLDWAAIFFFDRWLAEVCKGLAPAARPHGAQLCAIRKKPGQIAWSERIRGHLAANILADWFQIKLRRSWPEAQTKVALLAVELNKASAHLERKNLFVSEVALLPTRPELQRALSAWESDPKATPATALLDLPSLDRP